MQVRSFTPNVCPLDRVIPPLYITLFASGQASESAKPTANHLNGILLRMSQYVCDEKETCIDRDDR